MNRISDILLFCVLLLVGCGATPKSKTATVPEVSFNGDSAYAFVAGQVAFGPRVPGNDAHHDCVQYIGRALERMGAKVEVQTGDVQRYDGEWQHVANICAHLAADSAYVNEKAILLCAHYDSRPWADQEEDYTQRMIPIPGANDGASGVGVLMEVARQWPMLKERKRPVEIVLFDCEDMGTPAFYTGQQRNHTWCLGAQLWSRIYSKQKSEVRNQKSDISFGILLDMVGDPNATFPREYYSEQYAKKYVDKIWQAAEQLGYAHRFTDGRAYPITDDHYYVNTIAKIPCVDIIHYVPSETGFPWWWHTQKDDMSNISPNTLQEVGKVIMAVISE
ncbi:MAG: M28 family peptidase [Paludibacteraceae bacterium]|nr:M28 family peptidase [Paludibacteraceae bacterium]